ncbi:MAG: ABC transporter permease [Longimicrobiales bacterium]
MREIMIIIRREFFERVRTRAFLLGTIAFPIFMVAIFVLPRSFGGGTVERRLALVDEAPPPIGDRFVAALTAVADSGSGNRYTIERVGGRLLDVRDRLNARVLAEEIDGYIALPPGVTEDEPVLYRANNIGSGEVVRDLREAISEAVQAERLREAGLERADVSSLFRRVEIDDASVTESGSDGRNAEATFFFAYIVAFMIYFITVIYGTTVLRNVIEEKTNRIAEVMVSSVRASHLMLGKIVGVGSAALFQVGIWTAAVALIALRSDLIADRTGIPRDAFDAITIPAGQAVLFVLYFVLGFLLFAAVFAAAGAALNSEQESQSIQMPIMIPLFLPLILSFRITEDPNSPLAQALGLFPLTAPITMPIRISAGTIPAWEIAASLGLLVLGLFLTAWIAGKVFRVGILATGSRPSLRDLARWIREA